MSDFYFSLKNDPKGGPLDISFHILAAQNPPFLPVFSPLTRIIQPRNVDIFGFTDKIWPVHVLRNSY